MYPGCIFDSSLVYVNADFSFQANVLVSLYWFCFLLGVNSLYEHWKIWNSYWIIIEWHFSIFFCHELDKPDDVWKFSLCKYHWQGGKTNVPFKLMYSKLCKIIVQYRPPEDKDKNMLYHNGRQKNVKRTRCRGYKNNWKDLGIREIIERIGGYPVMFHRRLHLERHDSYSKCRERL